MSWTELFDWEMTNEADVLDDNSVDDHETDCGEKEEKCWVSAAAVESRVLECKLDT